MNGQTSCPPELHPVNLLTTSILHVSICGGGRKESRSGPKQGWVYRSIVEEKEERKIEDLSDLEPRTQSSGDGGEYLWSARTG